MQTFVVTLKSGAQQPVKAERWGILPAGNSLRFMPGNESYLSADVTFVHEEITGDDGETLYRRVWPTEGDPEQWD
jgi:hypothetical protein